jgi:hypothetical protein
VVALLDDQGDETAQQLAELLAHRLLGQVGGVDLWVVLE